MMLSSILNDEDMPALPSSRIPLSMDSEHESQTRGTAHKPGRALYHRKTARKGVQGAKRPTPAATVAPEFEAASAYLQQTAPLVHSAVGDRRRSCPSTHNGPREACADSEARHIETPLISHTPRSFDSINRSTNFSLRPDTTTNLQSHAQASTMHFGPAAHIAASPAPSHLKNNQYFDTYDDTALTLDEDPVEGVNMTNRSAYPRFSRAHTEATHAYLQLNHQSNGATSITTTNEINLNAHQNLPQAHNIAPKQPSRQDFSSKSLPPQHSTSDSLSSLHTQASAGEPWSALQNTARGSFLESSEPPDTSGGSSTTKLTSKSARPQTTVPMQTKPHISMLPNSTQKSRKIAISEPESLVGNWKAKHSIDLTRASRNSAQSTSRPKKDVTHFHGISQPRDSSAASPTVTLRQSVSRAHNPEVIDLTGVDDEHTIAGFQDLRCNQKRKLVKSAALSSSVSSNGSELPILQDIQQKMQTERLQFAFGREAHPTGFGSAPARDSSGSSDTLFIQEGQVNSVASPQCQSSVNTDETGSKVSSTKAITDPLVSAITTPEPPSNLPTSAGPSSPRSWICLISEHRSRFPKARREGEPECVCQMTDSARPLEPSDENMLQAIQPTTVQRAAGPDTSFAQLRKVMTVKERRRELRRKTFVRHGEDILDEIIKSDAANRPGSSDHASPLSIPNQPALHWANIDPRIHWTWPRTDEWYEGKQKDMSVRGNRKSHDHARKIYYGAFKCSSQTERIMADLIMKGQASKSRQAAAELDQMATIYHTTHSKNSSVAASHKRKGKGNAASRNAYCDNNDKEMMVV